MTTTGKKSTLSMAGYLSGGAKNMFPEHSHQKRKYYELRENKLFVRLKKSSNASTIVIDLKDSTCTRTNSKFGFTIEGPLIVGGSLTFMCESHSELIEWFIALEAMMKGEEHTIPKYTVIEGWLAKRKRQTNGRETAWQKRYAVLVGRTLKYYKVVNPSIAPGTTNATGVLDMADSLLITEQKDNSVDIHFPGVTYFLKFPSLEMQIRFCDTVKGNIDTALQSGLSGSLNVKLEAIKQADRNMLTAENILSQLDDRVENIRKGSITSSNGSSNGAAATVWSEPASKAEAKISRSVPTHQEEKNSPVAIKRADSTTKTKERSPVPLPRRRSFNASPSASTDKFMSADDAKSEIAIAGDMDISPNAPNKPRRKLSNSSQSCGIPKRSYSIPDGLMDTRIHEEEDALPPPQQRFATVGPKRRVPPNVPAPVPFLELWSTYVSSSPSPSPPMSPSSDALPVVTSREDKDERSFLEPDAAKGSTTEEQVEIVSEVMNTEAESNVVEAASQASTRSIPTVVVTENDDGGNDELVQLIDNVVVALDNALGENPDPCALRDSVDTVFNMDKLEATVTEIAATSRDMSGCSSVPCEDEKQYLRIEDEAYCDAGGELDDISTRSSFTSAGSNPRPNFNPCDNVREDMRQVRDTNDKFREEVSDEAAGNVHGVIITDSEPVADARGAESAEDAAPSVDKESANAEAILPPVETIYEEVANFGIQVPKDIGPEPVEHHGADNGVTHENIVHDKNIEIEEMVGEEGSGENAALPETKLDMAGNAAPTVEQGLTGNPKSDMAMNSNELDAKVASSSTEALDKVIANAMGDVDESLFVF